MKEASESRCVPVLKGWDCVDHDPIDEYKPATESVCYALALRIGPDDSSGGDFYYVTVATPEGLRELQPRSEGSTAGVPIILSDYSWQQVLTAVENRLAECADYGWPRVQDRLRAQFRWEYEDYRLPSNTRLELTR
jgi:hypothetical protein